MYNSIWSYFYELYCQDISHFLKCSWSQWIQQLVVKDHWEIRIQNELGILSIWSSAPSWPEIISVLLKKRNFQHAYTRWGNWVQKVFPPFPVLSLRINLWFPIFLSAKWGLILSIQWDKLLVVFSAVSGSFINIQQMLTVRIITSFSALLLSDQ